MTEKLPARRIYGLLLQDKEGEQWDWGEMIAGDLLAAQRDAKNALLAHPDYQIAVLNNRSGVPLLIVWQDGRTAADTKPLEPEEGE